MNEMGPYNLGNMQVLYISTVNAVQGLSLYAMSTRLDHYMLLVTQTIYKD